MLQNRESSKHWKYWGSKLLGFKIVREKEHISMVRDNPDGSRTPLTMPNHPKIKASTLRTICTQSGITRNEFLEAYKET